MKVYGIRPSETQPGKFEVMRVHVHTPEVAVLIHTADDFAAAERFVLTQVRLDRDAGKDSGYADMRREVP